MSEYIIQATHGSMDHPLQFGENLIIPCFVLEDERRVLLQTHMVEALGISSGGSTNPIKIERLERYAAQKGMDFTEMNKDRLTRFVFGKSLEPYISSDLLQAVSHPIRFRTPEGREALGYEASILVDLCEAVLQARLETRLQKQQMAIAQQCEILMRGFARVGIIALVDEATGYQAFRAKQALEDILKKFISEELAKWAKTFDDDFYKELFRLRHLTYSQVSSKRPAYIGKITNDIVYERLAPGVLDELKRITPRDDSGRLKHKLHQRLTPDVGHPKLREHLLKVITLMKVSPNYTYFYRLLERALPKYDKYGMQQPQLPMPLDDEE